MGKKKYNKGAQGQQNVQQQQAQPPQGTSQQPAQSTSQQPPPSTSAGEAKPAAKKPQIEDKFATLNVQTPEPSLSGAGDYHRKPQRGGKGSQSQRKPPPFAAPIQQPQAPFVVPSQQPQPLMAAPIRQPQPLMAAPIRQPQPLMAAPVRYSQAPFVAPSQQPQPLMTAPVQYPQAPTAAPVRYSQAPSGPPIPHLQAPFVAPSQQPQPLMTAPVRHPQGPAHFQQQPHQQMKSPVQSQPPTPTHPSTPTESDVPKKGRRQEKGPKAATVPKEQQKSSPSTKQQVSREQKARQEPVEKKEPEKRGKEGSPTDLIVPLRKQLNSGGTKGRRIMIETNHLLLVLKNLKPAIHYDVAIDPDKPKKCLRQVMENFRRMNYGTRYPAFDGTKNLYSSSPLPFGREIEGEVTIMLDDREKQYKVKVKYAAEIDLRCLMDYFGSRGRGNEHMVTPQEAIQALDIVLRNAPSLRCIPVGRSFFTKPTNPRDMVNLGEGMEMYSGIYQSAVLGWKPFLNVDVSHKAFPKPMHLLDLIPDLCGDRCNISQPLLHYNFETVDKFLRTLQVVYQIPNQPNTRRMMRVNQLDKPARDARFVNEQNREMTVAEYFANVKQVPLRYPHLPCLWVGSRERRILLPMEFCTVADRQVTNRTMTGDQTTAMIRSAATSTQVRKNKIMASVQQANYNADPCIKEFALSVNEEFTKVQARVLDPPDLRYQKATVRVQRGVWRADFFCQPSELHKWSIVCLNERTRQEELMEFGKMMINQGKTALGMNISPPQIVPPLNRLQRNKEMDAIRGVFEKLKDYQLILVVIPEIKEYYNYVKQAAELHVGVITQCVKGKNVFRPKPSTVGNILLKVNAKLNGLNHTLGRSPACLNVPCMIMGADVTHPSPESRGNVPSVAAVTASHDRFAFKYNITCRLQQSTQEIITDLANIVLEHLTYFEKVNKRKPERIIFFRDGVSEGQFDKVVKSEVQAVRQGCAKLDPSGNYKPKLTFLVVQKRHHTRFFPLNPRDSEDKNCNVPAGTVVDTDITHPSALDFYLVSHASIQGVARPTKYRKLWDDNDMQEDELEELTFHLCHLYARCTRSVSYPAPTYYAHLAAARAKVYCENQRIDMSNLERAQQLLRIKNEVVKGSPMFFV